jgi:flagellar biosynthesis GTPase FlhF
VGGWVRRYQDELREKVNAALASEAAPAGGGLMDLSTMAEYHAAILKELKGKYEEKIRSLQAKIMDEVRRDKARRDKATARRQQNTEEIKKAMLAAQKASERKIAKHKEFAAKRQKELKEVKKQLSEVVAKKEEEEKIEGWLQKRANKGVVKRWYWRWFAYEPLAHRLNYYTKEGPTIELKGFIDLRDCEKIYVLPNEEQVTMGLACVAPCWCLILRRACCVWR